MKRSNSVTHTDSCNTYNGISKYPVCSSIARNTQMNYGRQVVLRKIRIQLTLLWTRYWWTIQSSRERTYRERRKVFQLKCLFLIYATYSRACISPFPRWATTHLMVLGEYLVASNNKIPHNSMPIQRGIYANYCEHNDFAVFDIILDGHILDWDSVVKYCQEYGFYSTPEIKRGLWEDVSDFDVENYKSPTAEHFNGLNEIPSQIEGVIRPLGH